MRVVSAMRLGSAMRVVSEWCETQGARMPPTRQGQVLEI